MALDESGGGNMYMPVAPAYGYGGRGYSSRRDSMGRYSRDGSYRGYSRAGEKDAFIRQLQELVDTAPDDKTRMHVERLMREMDQN